MIANSKQILNVSLVDANTGDILQSQFGSYETLVMYYNLELQTGTMNHRCTVVTERGLVRQDTVSVRVRGLLLFTSYLILWFQFIPLLYSVRHLHTGNNQSTHRADIRRSESSVVSIGLVCVCVVLAIWIDIIILCVTYPARWVSSLTSRVLQM